MHTVQDVIQTVEEKTTTRKENMTRTQANDFEWEWRNGVRIRGNVKTNQTAQKKKEKKTTPPITSQNRWLVVVTRKICSSGREDSPGITDSVLLHSIRQRGLCRTNSTGRGSSPSHPLQQGRCGASAAATADTPTYATPRVRTATTDACARRL